jgi:hypothetical protein
MKKSLFSLGLIICLGLSIAIGIGACKSLPTLQEQFTQLCPVVNGDLQTIGTSPLLNVSQQQIIMGVPGDPSKPGVLAVNKAICAAGGQVNVTSMQALHDTLLPSVVMLIQGLPTFPNQTAILLGLNTFGPIVQGLVDQLIAAAAVKTVPASGAIPASAPVAASS